MRWFLRSAAAAAGIGAVGALAFAQPARLAAPVAPPLEMRPAAAEPTDAAQLRALQEAVPAPPVRRAWVEAASGAKPAPVQLVQAALPGAPVTRIGGPLPDEPPARPDRLPPFVPPAPKPKPPAVRLPAPPSPGPLPPIPTAPPLATVGPRVTPKPAAPTTVLAQPKPNPNTLPPAFPAVTAPPVSTGTAAACAGAAGPCPTQRVASVGCDPVWHLFPQDGAVRARGWLNGGYVYNSSNPDSKFNGPYNSVDRSAELMFNQAYLIVDRPLPTSGTFGAGFRIDALYGYDHYLAQSRGFEADRDFGTRWNGQYYGLAIPQAYAEVGNDIVSVKLGHFYSTVGYETLPAAGNFFYSHAYSYQFGQPFTHWGGVATVQITRNLQAHAGLVNGWDTLVGRANNVNFIGGLKYTPDSKLWWVSAALVSGDEQNNSARLPNVPGTEGNRSRYSVLLGLTPGGPCGKWEYVFHHHSGWQENGTPQQNFARWYGIDQYLYYRVSDSLKLGTRFEWFRDEDGTRVGLNRPGNPNNPPLPGNYFALTTGVNYAPTANLMIRPELRWDFTSDTNRRVFNDGRKNNQLLLGCDLVWRY